jgi:triosephosphate isomerase
VLNPKKIIVAYEPTWAIGTDSPVNPEHAERVAMFIKIKFKAGKVLYGGGTEAKNFRGFLQREIDGLLVGHASLDKEQFKEMILY